MYYLGPCGLDPSLDISLEDIDPSSLIFLQKSLPLPGWSYDYDKTMDDGRPMMLDITDDATGETHTQATENIPMYVNEVGHNKNLKESVVPIEGEDEISYRLCLEEPISVGETIELLVNYGDMYEDTRERHGYGKSSGCPDQLERDKVRLNQSELVQMGKFVFELVWKDGAPFEKDFLLRISWVMMSFESVTNRFTLK
mmetsp:Transcript_3669/g.4225  ORF Transcript_3669/g.4225 Transcript_3669/m.4225 type:complete len:198 (+) Transcript_3669:232-825(+)